jgi:FAD/FMN-containing dehydrogenase
MKREWTNWSGSLRFTPGRIVAPHSQHQVQEVIRQVRDDQGSCRAVGKGHSSSPLVKTEDTLITLEHLDGVESVDPEACEAWVRPGTTLEQMGESLLEEDLAIHNLGDVNVQQLGGAIGTGTHGTGKNLGNLSTMLLGFRMVTADGEVVEAHIEDEPDLVRAARLALGTLGVFTALRIRVQPAYRLHRQEWCAGVDDCLQHLHDLVEANRNFDFYWYPRSDEVKLRTLNMPGEAPSIPFADLLTEEIDWAPRIISRTRDLTFDEMEYCMPAAAGPEAFRVVREQMLRVHRRDVGWRTLYRTTAPDDAMLSPSYKRETAVLSVHQNATLPFESFFQEIEPILRDHHGRPHWGKKHSLRGPQLAALYPEWEDFQAIRRRLDPDGLFLTPYFRELFGLDRPLTDGG